MQKLLTNIYKVYRDTGSDGWGYSYLLQRDEGNIFLPRMAKNATITGELDAIADAGGIHAIYVTDFHFAGTGLPEVADRFGVEVQCSRVEVPKIRKRGLDNLTAFDFTRHHRAPDWEVIPTPGHTSGGVCFLWTDGDERYLFTGDFLYNTGAEWVVGSKTLAKVAASLAVIRTIDFTYLVGCGDDDAGTPYRAMDAAQTHEFIDAIIANFG